MHGDIIENGQMCGVNGCQHVTVAFLAGGDMDADVTQKFIGISISVKQVCKTSSGAWEYLHVNEGVVLLADGNKVLVRRGNSRT